MLGWVWAANYCSVSYCSVSANILNRAGLVVDALGLAVTGVEVIGGEAGSCIWATSRAEAAALLLDLLIPAYE